MERLFKKKNLNEITGDEMAANIDALNKIYDLAKELERKNQLLSAKYHNDKKYARIHKRLMEKGNLTKSESQLFEALAGLKEKADDKILQNAKMMNNEAFVEKMMVRLVIDEFKNRSNIPLDARTSKMINKMIVKEYLNEYKGKAA